MFIEVQQGVKRLSSLENVLGSSIPFSTTMIFTPPAPKKKETLKSYIVSCSKSELSLEINRQLILGRNTSLHISSTVSEKGSSRVIPRQPIPSD